MGCRRIASETDSRLRCFGKKGAAMRKYAVVVCFLILSISLSAQPNTSTRAIRIRDLAIGGVSHVSSAELASIEAELKQECCDRAETQEIRDRISYAFQQRGYFEVHVNQLNVTPLALHTTPPAIAVSVDLSDGQQFKLKWIKFNGEKAFSSDELRQQFLISDVDIFNVDKIRLGLENLRKLYASHGFINFTPVPNTEADDASATVTLTIGVDEGWHFRLGSLLLDGEEPHAGDGAKLIEAWKPMQGKIYDGNKIEQRWELASSMLPAGSRLEQSLELKQDPSAGIVTALLRFPDAK